MTPLLAGVEALGLALNAGQRAQFERYQRSLIRWNRRLNLTAIRDPQGIQVRHFVDSLSCTLATGDLNGQSLVDVGTGAGFPGLPLKLLYPGCRLLLIESAAKKARFLEAMIDELELSGVEIVAGRAESLGRDPAYRGRFDWAVARGVAELSVLAEYLLPLVKIGGHILAQKGSGATAEVAGARRALTVLGGGEAQVRGLGLSGPLEGHNLVTVEKIGQTPDRYPRRPGIPAKRPL